MRESVGATFLFKIMIVFIFFFTAFLAIAINYSQAFRIKNQIINALEQYEGYNEESIKAIDQAVNNSGYYRNITNCGEKGIQVKNGAKTVNGVCISAKKYGTSGKAYFKVSTFVSFNFPIIGNTLTLPVIGETKAITTDYTTINGSDSNFWK